MKRNSLQEPSIKDIAAAAGVSTATVSRVFNKSDQVRPALAAAVLKAAGEAGYQPRQATRKDTIVLLVEHLDRIRLSAESYDGMIMKSLIVAAAHRNMRTEILTPEEIPLIREKFIAGIISILYEPESLELLKRVEGPSLVAINTGISNATCICSDERQGIELAVDHLAKRGHQRIELLTDSGQTWSRAERIAGLQESLEKRGFPFSPDSVHIANDPQKILYELIRALKDGPTALITPGESLGVMLAHYFSVMGKKVPEDISLIGYEYSGVSEFLSPPQTCLAQNFEELAEHALDAITGRTEKDFRVSPIMAPYRLIERESVRALK